jgi:hypothetical protein
LRGHPGAAQIGQRVRAKATAGLIDTTGRVFLAGSLMGLDDSVFSFAARMSGTIAHA